MSTIFDSFERKHDFLICVDSDGCAMDTMDIKHFRCFGPCMIEVWGLHAHEKELLARWNEVNLYTMTRGINRFKGLAIALKEAEESYDDVRIEDLETFLHWTETTKELSNRAIEEVLAQRESKSLRMALEWSNQVNAAIQNLPEEENLPFEGAKAGLAAAHAVADVAIVSSANAGAVKEEWTRHNLIEHTDIMLAQDAGTKAYCISQLLQAGYEKDHVLMIGDAPGDQKAAEDNGVLYYPILVKKEKSSWEQFLSEGLEKFLSGTYAGIYQEERIEEFQKNLSE
ncbi:MAG: HAD hydrolase-like protein [Lachnospiraceae bacterium]|nr:HAD hydrolase-like protein [Lachnospiraceae bacterium]